MDAKKKKDIKEIWINKIDTKEAALLVIRECSYGFYFVAAFAAVASIFLGASFLIDGIIFAACAFLLSKFKHVLLAFILFFLSGAGLVTTIINSFHGKSGSNIFLAIVLVWISVRAIQATFWLRRYKHEKTSALEKAIDTIMHSRKMSKKTPVLFKICISGSALSMIAAVVCAFFGFFDKNYTVLNFLFAGGMVLFGAAMFIGLQAKIFMNSKKSARGKQDVSETYHM